MKFVDIDKVKKDLAKEKGYWSAEDFAKACENAAFYTTLDDFMTEHADEIEMMCFAPTPERCGSWDCIDGDGEVYQCTACGVQIGVGIETDPRDFAFCPFCGACMDAADDQGGGGENATD